MKIDEETRKLLSIIQVNDKERRAEVTRYKASIRSLEGIHRQKVRDLQQIIAERDLEITLIRSSISYRIGNACVRIARGAKSQAGSVANLRNPLTLSSRSPRRLRKTYASVAESSSVLRTVRSRPEDVPVVRGISEEARILVGSVQARRETGPRVLDDFEREALAAFAEQPRAAWQFDRDEGLLRLVRAVLGPFPEVVTQGPSDRIGKGRLLIDARTLQGGRLDGTARHAANVLESVLAHRDRWEGVTLLIDAGQPALPDSVAGPADQVGIDRVRPDLVSLTSGFLQLQPFHQLRHGEVVDALLMAPWIRTATVWLDAIAGTYPRHFLRAPESFLSYQWFVERLRHYDQVLALSESARGEVLPLVTEAQGVLVTGCRNPLRNHVPEGSDQRRAMDPETRVALFANALPHKNLVAGMCAFAYAYFRYDGALRLDVVANLSDEQVAAARSLLASLDDALQAAVMFHRRLSDSRLAVVLSHATASLVPSFHEGFSLPVLESFAFGIPVVASDIPAHRELLGPDYPLAPPDDPVALGRNLLRALDDRVALAEQLKDAPVSRSEARFAAAMASFVDGFSQPPAR